MKNIANKVLAFGLINVLAMLSVFLSIPITTACNSTQALAEVEKFQPVVLNTLNLACVISPGAALCSTGAALIKNDYTVVVQLWGDYNTAVAAGTSTVAAWNALNAAFATFAKDSSQIFALASGLNAPEITAVVAAAQLLLGTIEAIFPNAPAGANGTKSAVFTASAMGHTSMNREQLKNWELDYNQKLDVASKAHPTAKVKHVHIHGLAERVLTAGIAK